jgi:ribosomal protein L34
MLAVLIVMTGYDATAQTAAQKQKRFKSPDAAVKALMDACVANDVNALVALFGPGSQDLVSSGDEVDDARGRQMFVKAYGEAHRLEKAADGKRILYVGKDDWPMPVPIVKAGKRWRFQTEEGRQEILSRRVGKNELDAIQTCLAIVDAQKEYAVLDRDTDQLLEYAQKFESESGKRDGLYWETAPGEPLSPLGPLVALAAAEGYGKAAQMSPYHGYLFRIITAQGENANGGAYSYMVDGSMIGGFAIVAYPALYRSSGVKTFIVNHEGIVYEKDLGAETAKIAAAITVFDPDKSWQKVKAQ